MKFLDHLRAHLERGGMPAEDVLAACLPLFRQVQEAHERGQVAPLQSVDDLHVQGTALWFENAKLAAPTLAPDALARLSSPSPAAVDVVTRQLRTTTEAGGLAQRDATIGDLSTDLTAPQYLPGYQCWEHRVGHHDALGDVYVLGLVLASLACGLDLADPGELERFVRHRANLFAIAPRLNPVIAHLAARMTELDRHRRVQDVGEVIRRLERYRDPLPESFAELSGVKGFSEAPLTGKRQLLQARLRDRLFDVSRRNRLIFHRAGMQSLNLTVSSVPLLLDVRNVRPEHLLTWHGEVAQTLSSGGTLALNRYLRFEDAPYLPAALDKIRADARRDQAEVGFSQLRLAICFFRWHNLKEAPAERIHSPLILLPVELARKKGVKDAYTLTATTTVGEVNPSLRHMLKQLYGLRLPDAVDLREADLAEFHRILQEQIHASEPGVVLDRVDRPRIELIVERARQRLDQYRRRLRLSGRGVRTLHDVDYCYDRDNFQPLGLALYRTLVRPAPAPIRHLLRTPAQATPQWAVEPVQEKQLFHLKEGSGENPYRWDFDLCSVTLGNFNTRKMSLVRDYAHLLEADAPHPSFDAVFSLAAAPAPPPAEVDRAALHPVIASDPTQTRALARARAGETFIIQGPPGTGKSQSITNLIADCVAAGKRVLFVCQKRAAIDVVFHRLKQQGLDALCCLVHDALADKKEFIRDLKETYQRHLAPGPEPESPLARRAQVLDELARELAPLERFSAAMSARPASAGLPLRDLVARLVELRAHVPPLSPAQSPDVPAYRFWPEHAATVRLVHAALGGPLASRALRWLAPPALEADRPQDRVARGLEAIAGLARDLEERLAAAPLPRERWATIGQAGEVLTFAQQVEPLARRGALEMLAAEHPRARELAQAARELGALRERVAEVAARNDGWREKVSPADVAVMLEQARALEGSMLSVFTPSYWRMRSALNARYDFARHAVPPTWVQVLQALAAEYDERDRFRAAERAAEARLGIDGVDDTLELIARVRERVGAAGPGAWIARLPAPEATALIDALMAASPLLDRLEQETPRWLVDYDPRARTFAGLREDLAALAGELTTLPRVLAALVELGRAPAELAHALRRLPLSPDQLEAAMARLTVDDACQRDAALHTVNAAVLERHAARLSDSHRAWLALNGQAVLHGTRARFRERVRLSELPAAQLTPEQKEFKKGYAAGRRELEHEFGKTMRYRSVRDLLAGPSGEVIQDLKPIWLMSPLSVSDVLPFDSAHFDVVIFDEASQIPLEEAVPALYRARQMIVVGDEMQLPPTSFFAARAEDDDNLVIEHDGATVAYDLDTDSFFTQAARNLPSTYLGWHYRSRSESLISFSNRAFYQGRLLTVPDAALPDPAAGELSLATPDAVPAAIDAVLARPLAFCRVESAVYANRTNPREAECAAQLVRELLVRRPELSIGLVAFSEAQQGEIERALAVLAEADPAFQARLEEAQEREEDGQYCGLFVKNLENVQGDERDVIVLSVCYGPDANGRMLMNFGPINQAGGEKRLNVVFSRARHHMVVVSSITSGQITNDYNDGARALKQYLAYAEASSRGDLAGAARVLAALSHARDDAGSADPVAAQIAAALRERGFEADLALGQSGFRVDVGVRRPGARAYALGLLVDTAAFHASGTALERYLQRPAVLRAFGWKVLLVLGREWWEAPEAVLDRIAAELAG